ncbi:MAG: hypothetical protein JO255_11115 [Alphaproteobacteria bacterium]|nr:hypothetical protein [Alphaproteobacteria bacterium]
MHSKALTRALVLASLALAAGSNAAHAASNPCDPLTYGAVGDGVTDNTVAIQTAVDKCAALGGGVVPFNSGTFLTGPFTLASHIYLEVNAGATILGTLDQSRYVPAYIGAPYAPNEALISANGATNVGIIGNGTIDGQGGVNPPGGTSWYAQAAATSAAISAGTITHYTSFPMAPTSNGLPRPWLVEFWDSSEVVVSGIHLQNAPMWTLGLRYVTNATVTNVTVNNPSTSPNTDGTDVVSSTNVVISNVNYSDGDDDVAIKSGLPPIYQSQPGALPQVPSSHVTVANATFTAGHGISVGSETINGMNNILITNVTMSGTSNGFRIKTGRDRGNQIHDITVQNVKMTNVTAPIVINSYYPASSPPTCCTDPAQPITATTPFIYNVMISGVTATGATGLSFISGLPESPVLNVIMKNVSITNASNKVKPLDLRYMTGNFTNVSDSPTTTGKNFTVDNGVTVTGESIP